jgi:hypothetical protein
LGHKWDEEGEYKQYCKRKKCTAYRTLMENKYPKILFFNKKRPS